MKFRAIAVTLAACWFSTTWGGGVGGFDGGSSDMIRTRNGPILFQDYSMHVNPYLNKTVCLTSDDLYRANVTRLIYDRPGHDDSDYDVIKQTIFQSRVSMTNKCFQRDNEGKCLKQEWVGFVQSRERVIEIKDNKGDVVDRVRLRIPKCR